jgi:hypothetical protein
MNNLLNMTRSRWFAVLEKIGLNMKLNRLVTVALLLGVLWLRATPVFGAEEEGIALAIVYDTSGSMNDPVKDEHGSPAPKFRIANRALIAIADRIQAFATNSSTGTPRKIQAELLTFQKGRPHVAMPLAPFNAEALKSWAGNFSSPDGGTPLGDSLNTAAGALLRSGLSHKHVLFITDGMNTMGPEPATVLAKLQQEAIQKQTSVSVHFVAFDVDDKVFNGVKKLGATVVAASNENQLNAQLGFILEKKILLEDEESPAPKKP